MALDLKQLETQSSKPEKKGFKIDLSAEINIPGFNGSKLKRNANFFQELSMLISSGIDLKSSLEIIINETEKKKESEIHQQVLENIISGATLSDAIKNTNEFSPFDYFNIKIGEETGNLEAVLELLNKYYSRIIETRKKIFSALTYPALIIVISVLAVIVMMKFVVPTFSDVYTRLGQDLPGITSFILKISSNLGQYSLVALLVAVLFATSWYFVRKNNKYLGKAQNVFLKLPFIGPYLKHVHIEKFFHSLSILMQAKINLVQSFDILHEMTGFLPLKEAIKTVKNDLISGEPLSDSMKKHKHLFEGRKVSLIKVGEEVNKLDFAIKKIEMQLEERTQNVTRNFTSTLEPLLIIFVGGMVGVILIAMYLPIFKLSNSFF